MINESDCVFFLFRVPHWETQNLPLYVSLFDENDESATTGIGMKKVPNLFNDWLRTL